MGRMRVLMLTAFPATGGPLPKLAPLVADGLSRCGCEVVIEGWSAHRAGHESVVAKLLGRSADLLRVQRRIREWRPDVIYVATAHNWPALLRDLPLALTVPRGRPPLVVHLHGSESERLGARGHALFKACSACLARRAAAVMLLSAEEREEWERFCPEGRYEVVVNPFVPAEVSAGNARGTAAACAAPPVLLTVARLIPQKGILDLVEALAIVCRDRSSRLLIVGSGPARDELARRVERLGLCDLVDLLGYVKGPALDSAFRSADVFVLASYHDEGFPLSVMEAMGHGLPIVTTRIRGCADHLAPDVNAVFVPPRDARAIAAAIERLLDDDDLRMRMGRANAAKVADFAPEAVMPRYAEILRSVVGDGTNAGSTDGTASRSPSSS